MKYYTALLLLIAAALGFVACNTYPTYSGTNGIQGYATHPPKFPHMGNNIPVENARIRITDANGTVITTAKTDRNGWYGVDLSTGYYILEALEPEPQAAVGVPEEDNPRTVLVIEGEKTRADFVYRSFLK